MRTRVLVLISIAHLFLVLHAEASEPIILRLTFPEGRTVTYKYKYKSRYSSDQAEHILPQRIARPGRVSVEVNGSWKNLELVRILAEDPAEGEASEEIGILARVEEATSKVIFGGNIVSSQEWDPYDMAELSGRNFSWKIGPEGEVSDFMAEFPEYELYRQDLISEFGQFLMPEYHPVLPKDPVNVGDTWSGTRSFESSFFLGGVRRYHKPLVKIKSLYKLKKLGKKKGRRTAEIEESREIEYTGWMFAAYVSVIMRGEGHGTAKWIIDVDRGLVLSQKTRFDLERPEVFLLGSESALGKVIADFRLDFERKLDKVEE